LSLQTIHLSLAFVLAKARAKEYKDEVRFARQGPEEAE